MTNSLWTRFVALGLAGLMTTTTIAQGVLPAVDLGKDLGKNLLALVAPGDKLPFYSERPAPYNHPANATRDESRSAWWTPEMLLERNLAENPEIILNSSLAMATGDVLSASGYLASWSNNPTTGRGIPGEGIGPGGGSNGSQVIGSPGSHGLGGTVNTNTGNKLSTLQIVDIPARGDAKLGLTLYHNSTKTYNGDFGNDWSHTYDSRITELTTVAYVRMPDGLEVPYAKSGSTFTPPAGWHHTLVKNTGGTWTLTFKNQSKWEYNTSNRLVAVKDRYGNTITINRDALTQRITTITTPDDRRLNFTYTSNDVTKIEFQALNSSWLVLRTWDFHYTSGNLTKITYPSNAPNTNERILTYDGNRNIIKEQDLNGTFSGKEWKFAYDSNDRLLNFENPLGNQFWYSYSSAGFTIMEMPGGETAIHYYTGSKVTTTEDAGAFQASYVYDSALNITQMTDRGGDVWNYTYDTNGNRLTVDDPTATANWVYTYNSNNDLTSVTSPLGNETKLFYTGTPNVFLDRIEQEVDGTADWRITEVTMDANGQVTQIEDELGRDQFMTYNTRGDLTKTEDTVGVETEYAYNDFGLPEWTEDDSNNRTTYTYDNFLRMTEIDHPGTGTGNVLYSYDGEGAVISMTNELGQTATALYDNARRKTRDSSALSVATHYVYNSNGWLLTEGVGVSSPGTIRRTYTYTGRGEVYTLVIGSATNAETWSYSPEGELAAYENQAGQQIVYDYDAASRMTSIDYPNDPTTSFTYDQDGRQATMVDSIGTTTWTYNRAGDVTALDVPGTAGDLTYAYNAVGQLTTTTRGSDVLTNAYDSAGRLSSITNPLSEVTSFAYDSRGHLSTRTFHSGAKEEFTYDSRSRVTDIVLKNSSNTTLQSQSYIFDNASQVTRHIVDGVHTAYVYDNGGQLIEEWWTLNLNGTPTDLSDDTWTDRDVYNYDNVGNRTRKRVFLGGSSTPTTDDVYTYLAGNGDLLEKIERNGTLFREYVYDAMGRTTSVWKTGVGTTTYSYNEDSRLTGITYPGPSSDSMTYNGMGTRVSRTEAGVTNDYIRDGVGVTDPVLADSGATYTPGISERRGGVTTYLHSGLKNADAQSGSSQTISASRKYDAWGNVRSSMGTWQGPFGHAGGFGYQSNDRSGLQLLGHRYYDPETGRFLSTDPIKDGRNWHAYGGGVNNPVTGVDPTGLKIHSTIGYSVAPFERPGTYEWCTEPLGELITVRPGEGRPTDPNYDRPQEDLGDELANSMGAMAFSETMGAVLPEGTSAVVGVGLTLLDGAKTLGDGLDTFGGHKARIEYGLEGNIEKASGCPDQAFFDRYGHRLRSWRYGS